MESRQLWKCPEATMQVSRVVQSCPSGFPTPRHMRSRAAWTWTEYQTYIRHIISDILEIWLIWWRKNENGGFEHLWTPKWKRAPWSRSNSLPTLESNRTWYVKPVQIWKLTRPFLQSCNMLMVCPWKRHFGDGQMTNSTGISRIYTLRRRKAEATDIFAGSFMYIYVISRGTWSTHFAGFTFTYYRWKDVLYRNLRSYHFHSSRFSYCRHCWLSSWNNSNCASCVSGANQANCGAIERMEVSQSVSLYNYVETNLPQDTNWEWDALGLSSIECLLSDILLDFGDRVHVSKWYHKQ